MPSYQHWAKKAIAFGPSKIRRPNLQKVFWNHPYSALVNINVYANQYLVEMKYICGVPVIVPQQAKK